MTVVFFRFGTDPRPMFSGIEDIEYIDLSPDSNLLMTTMIPKGAWVWFVVGDKAYNIAGDTRRKGKRYETRGNEIC